jgi:hypothetical protein
MESPVASPVTARRLSRIDISEKETALRHNEDGLEATRLFYTVTVNE